MAENNKANHEEHRGSRITREQIKDFVERTHQHGFFKGKKGQRKLNEKVNGMRKFLKDSGFELKTFEDGPKR